MGHKQLQAAAWAVCLATAGADADQNARIPYPVLDADPDVSGGGATPAFEALHAPEDRGANGAAGTFTASSLPPLPLPGHQRVCTDTFCGHCVDIPESEDPCQTRYRSHMIFGAEGSLQCVRCPTRPIPPPPPPPPPPQPIPCSNDEMDSAASLSLRAIPKEPWERLESYTCMSSGALNIRWLGSSQGEKDVCEVKASSPTSTSGYGHSHPHFKYPRDKNLFCRGGKITSDTVADRTNRRNKNFSRGDKSGAKSRKKPLYLVVPERDVVKVYRIVGKGFWGGDKWAVEIVQ